MHFCNRSMRRRFCSTVRSGGSGGGVMPNRSNIICDKGHYHIIRLGRWYGKRTGLADEVEPQFAKLSPPCAQSRRDVDLDLRPPRSGNAQLLLTRGPSPLFKQREKFVRHEARARGI